MPHDILPENKVLFSLCSKPPFGGLEQSLALISQRGSFLNLDYVLPNVASFKICVKRSPLRGLFTLITFLLPAVTELRLMQNKYLYRISSFYEKRIDTAKDQTTEAKRF